MRTTLISAVACILGTAAVASAPGKHLSGDYLMTVDGKTIEVVRVPMPEGHIRNVLERQPYSYAPFVATGTVEVCVQSGLFDMTKAEFLPKSKPVEIRARSPHHVSFRMTPPMTVVLEPKGRHRALVVSANLPEEKVKRSGEGEGRGVRYFGPGFHHPDTIDLGDGETLYLAPGAWVEGAVRAKGRNITICGSGVLSGACYEWRKGPKSTSDANRTIGNLACLSGENITVRDVTLFSSWGWTLVFNSVTNALVDNVKVICGRVINDDGIDICRAKDVVLRNSFVRCQDDCIAPKWWCENFVCTNMTLWTDAANAFRTGYECESGASGLVFRNLLFKDIDVLHLALDKSRASDYWANCAIYIQPSHGQPMTDTVYDDIRFYECGPRDIFLNVKTMPIAEGYSFKEAGYLKGLTLRNIHLPDAQGGMDVNFSAHDDAHPIEGVRFDNVTGFGPVTKSGKVDFELPDLVVYEGEPKKMLEEPIEFPGPWDLANHGTLSIDVENTSATDDVRLALDLGDETDTRFHMTMVPAGFKGTLDIDVHPRFAHPEVVTKMKLMQASPFAVGSYRPDLLVREIVTARVPVIKLAHHWSGSSTAADGATPTLLVKRVVAKNTVARAWPSWYSMDANAFFPFVDRYGQFRFKDWPRKVSSDADLKAAAEAEKADLAAHPACADRNEFGGWTKGPQLEATGRFRLEKIDGKWWFVDPKGRLWWSHGVVRVTPSTAVTPLDGREEYFAELPEEKVEKAGGGGELGVNPFCAFYHTYDELLRPYYVKKGWTRTYDFSAANLLRKYGADWRAVYGDLSHRRLRSWGLNTIANSSDRAIRMMNRTPWIERLETRGPKCKEQKGEGWWHVPDPFHPEFRRYFRELLESRREELSSPYCAGVFVDNEHDWRGISDKTVREYFKVIREELRRFDPKLLYFGCRFAGQADARLVRLCAEQADAISYNIYTFRLDTLKLPEGVDKPIIIGEFHFGSTSDTGLFNGSLVPVANQAERAKAYKRYVTDALRHPNVVGTHWHQFSDQPLTGRFDGEDFNVGFTDVCDTPYPEMRQALREIGTSMYEIRRTPSADVDPRAFGAKGDGVTKDTVALQRALDAAADGGRVILKDGTFVTGTLEMKGGTELFIDASAVLQGSPDIADYRSPPNAPTVDPAKLARGNNACLVYATCATNVAITGRGVLDCNGARFVRPSNPDDWAGWAYQRIPAKTPPRVVFFCSCRGVRVTDVLMRNQPSGWSYWAHDCEDVLFDRCRIRASLLYPNNDGIHVNSCRNVVVRNCDIETGDDSIVVRANNRSLLRAANPVCENVVVSNCTLSSATCGIRIGWTDDGEMRNCLFRDLVIREAMVGVAFVFPRRGPWNRYDFGREASHAHDMVFEDIEMKAVYGRPVLGWVHMPASGQPPEKDVVWPRVEAVENIVFRRVRSKGLEPPLWKMAPASPARGIVYEDCDFQCVPDSELPGYLRHGAYWDRLPTEASDTFTQGFVTNGAPIVVFRLPKDGEHRAWLGDGAYGFVCERPDGSRLTERDAWKVSVNAFEKVAHVFWFGDGWEAHVRFVKRDGAWCADEPSFSQKGSQIRLNPYRRKGNCAAEGVTTK